MLYRHGRNTHTRSTRLLPIDELSSQDDGRAVIRDDESLESWRACRDLLTQRTMGTSSFDQSGNGRHPIRQESPWASRPNAVRDRFRRARGIKMDFEKSLRDEQRDFIRRNLT